MSDLNKHINVRPERDTSVECYRVLLMFGIILLHSITQCGFCRRGLDNVLSTCVDSFVFISGYYGIRFTLGKLARLVLIGLFCATVAALCGGLGFVGVVRVLVKNGCYWFLWTYIACMMCSPIINAGIDALASEGKLIWGGGGGRLPRHCFRLVVHGSHAIHWRVCAYHKRLWFNWLDQYAWHIYRGAYL